MEVLDQAESHKEEERYKEDMLTNSDDSQTDGTGMSPNAMSTCPLDTKEASQVYHVPRPKYPIVFLLIAAANLSLQ